MSTYIGGVEVAGNSVLIGSTLYGICTTSANGLNKQVILDNFDSFLHGVTVQVRFIYGNNILDNLTLQVGTTTAQPITGNCICNANDVIAFTLEDSGNNSYYWRANQSIKIDSYVDNTSNSTIITKIAGQEVNIATQSYVDYKTAGMSGLEGAMHFKGTVNEDPTSAAFNTHSFSDYDYGDVILGPNNKEYIYNKGNTISNSSWREVGDEGSYVLKTSQTSERIGSASDWDAGSAPILGDVIESDDITQWEPGSPSIALVEDGVLHIRNGMAPTLAFTARNIPNITDVGRVPSLTVTSTPVVVPLENGGEING